ncbi:hypothetical protein [Nonomuraea sp. bgisy101]|uniref:hypothetical protein n=1 Tax=Nonomuraea sp. bgisy101 TaxID=3413784 RepID=UPI003D712E70
MIHVIPAGTVSAEQPAARYAVVTASTGDDSLVRPGFARAGESRRAHMLAVNERLGFVAHRRTHAYQFTMEKQ